MKDRRFRRLTPAEPGWGGRPPRPDLDHELFETCRGAVDRVLATLPVRDRLVVEDHQAEVVAATHRETRAALEKLVGALQHVA